MKECKVLYVRESSDDYENNIINMDGNRGIPSTSVNALVKYLKIMLQLMDDMKKTPQEKSRAFKEISQQWGIRLPDSFSEEELKTYILKEIEKV